MTYMDIIDLAGNAILIGLMIAVLVTGGKENKYLNELEKRVEFLEDELNGSS